MLLRNATLIDGTGADPVDDAVVLVDGATISWAGPAAAAPAPAPDTTTVDLGGHTICPGFFDCHVHFHLPGPNGSPLQMALRPASYRHFELIDRLRTTVRNGITTARDLMGIDAGVRDAVAAGLIEGPRLLVAIEMLSQSSGHADFHLPCGLDLTPLVCGFLVDSVVAAHLLALVSVLCGAAVFWNAHRGGAR